MTQQRDPGADHAIRIVEKMTHLSIRARWPEFRTVIRARLLLFFVIAQY